MSTYPSSDMEKQSLWAASRDELLQVVDASWQTLATPNVSADGTFEYEPSVEGSSTQRTSQRREKELPCAVIAAVAPDSPAYDAGFEPGCCITAVNGEPLRDIIDWRWQSADDVVTLSYIDREGDSGEVMLERYPEEDWGIEFDGVVFDQIKLCRNSCTFCFMRQLPANMRPSLSLRDDDFRLSFLSGTFVTMTNITPEDEARILQQRISPLRVSLHAISPDVREKLIGKHAPHGLAVIERLLEQDIEMHAQIVLVPGVNDGEELERTLEWAYAHPAMVEVGIVPLGYTRHQDIFQRSFNSPFAARNVLKLIAPFQKQARSQRKCTWVYAADEFYRNAYQDRMIDMLPSASFYGDFGMFEDGVGIIRTFIDDWEKCEGKGIVQKLSGELEASGKKAVMVVGYAMMPFFEQLVARSPLKDAFRVFPVENRFFGGNVDVTGLLTSYDVAHALTGEVSNDTDIVVIPKVVLNDNGIMLDDGTINDICEQTGVMVHAVSCNPSGFLREIRNLL